MVSNTSVRPLGASGRGRRSLGCVLLSGLLVGAGAVGLSPAQAGVAPPPPANPFLGSGAAAFSVLGASTVTNTGPSVLTGDLGVYPGTAITGFPPGVVNGTLHAADTVSQQAQDEVATAYTTLAGLPSDTNLTGQDLGGLTLTPGVATFNTSAALTGTVTLDAQGDPDAAFVVQVGTALTTATESQVSYINGAQPCHTFWQVGGQATLGTGSSFAGNLLAQTSITAGTATSVTGRLLAGNGAVTLDTNSVTAATCAPELTVTESADPPSRPAPGGSYTYTVAVTNTGDSSATLTSLTDDVYGDLAGQGTCATDVGIAAGATYTCTYTGTYTGTAGSSRTDTVTATTTDAVERTATASGSATVALTAAAVRTGVLEVCKKADNSAGAVTGSYRFAVAGRTVTVPVGTCTGPLTVPAGDVTVVELANDATRMNACGSRPTVALRLCDPANRTSVVHVTAGGVAQETVLSITNRRLNGANVGSVKVCKVAGTGVAVGTPFTFTVGARTVSVPAGPADQGGYCKILAGFDRTKRVTVTEKATAGVLLQGVKVQPAARKVTSSLARRFVTVQPASTMTVVTFTNTTAE